LGNKHMQEPSPLAYAVALGLVVILTALAIAF
jgi:hypothetical protein